MLNECNVFIYEFHWPISLITNGWLIECLRSSHLKEEFILRRSVIDKICFPKIFFLNYDKKREKFIYLVEFCHHQKGEIVVLLFIVVLIVIPYFGIKLSGNLREIKIPKISLIVKIGR